jgi:hypothetical protein
LEGFRQDTDGHESRNAALPRRTDRIEELVTALGLIEMFKNADIRNFQDMLK